MGRDTHTLSNPGRESFSGRTVQDVKERRDLDDGPDGADSAARPCGAGIRSGNLHFWVCLGYNGWSDGIGDAGARAIGSWRFFFSCSDASVFFLPCALRWEADSCHGSSAWLWFLS